jgi:hypothetical protein
MIANDEFENIILKYCGNYVLLVYFAVLNVSLDSVVDMQDVPGVWCHTSGAYSGFPKEILSNRNPCAQT